MLNVRHNFDAAGPQFYPTCENHIGTRAQETERGGIGKCPGCKGWIELAEFGRIPEHEPADPTYYRCPMCTAPYAYASYTDPPCNRCAAKIDVAEWLRKGALPEEIRAALGDLADDLMYELENDGDLYYEDDGNDYEDYV